MGPLKPGLGFPPGFFFAQFFSFPSVLIRIRLQRRSHQELGDDARLRWPILGLVQWSLPEEQLCQHIFRGTSTFYRLRRSSNFCFICSVVVVAKWCNTPLVMVCLNPSGWWAFSIFSWRLVLSRAVLGKPRSIHTVLACLDAL